MNGLRADWKLAALSAALPLLAACSLLFASPPLAHVAAPALKVAYALTDTHAATIPRQGAQQRLSRKVDREAANVRLFPDAPSVPSACEAVPPRGIHAGQVVPPSPCRWDARGMVHLPRGPPTLPSLI